MRFKTNTQKTRLNFRVRFLFAVWNEDVINGLMSKTVEIPPAIFIAKFICAIIVVRIGRQFFNAKIMTNYDNVYDSRKN